MNEYYSLRSHFATLNPNRGQHRKYIPFVFTEPGVSMLSAVLKSKKAIQVSIKIITAFVEMCRFLVNNAAVFEKFHQVDQKLLEHDENFIKLFDAIEQKKLTPKQGIFFNGQVFDAFMFISKLIIVGSFLQKTPKNTFIKILQPNSVKIIIFALKQKSGE